jgi:hypothetical protein
MASTSTLSDRRFGRNRRTYPDAPALPVLWPIAVEPPALRPHDPGLFGFLAV